MASSFHRICVVGPGALGGMLAVRLVRAGFETCALARPARVARINGNGITLQSDGKIFTERVPASADPVVLGRQDLVFVTVKYINLREIASQLENLCRPNTSLVFLLNGVPWWFFQGFSGPHAGATLKSVDPDGELERSISRERIVWGPIEVGAAELPDGTVLHKMSNKIWLGRADNTMRDVAEIGHVLRVAGYDVTTTDKVRDALWSKLQVNMAINPISALTMADTRDLITDPIVGDLITGILAESRRVGDALGLTSGIDYAPVLKQNARKMIAGARSSMAQDMARGRPIEWEAIMAAPAEIADMMGVPVPLTKLVLGLIRMRAKSTTPSI